MNKIFLLSKGLFFIMISSVLIGIASALFLVSLDFVTDARYVLPYVYLFLPLVGFLVGYIYYRYAEKSNEGSNLIIDEFHNPKNVLPKRMGILIYIATVLSHLVGASVGREGTAVQMGASISDNLYKALKLNFLSRKLLLVVGISAGFASVFGTPLAASVFAVEIFHRGQIQFKYYIPSLIAAYIAHYTCLTLGIVHTNYFVTFIPEFSITTIFWSINAGIAFGIAAFIFVKLVHFLTSSANLIIKFAPFRPLIAGVLLMILYSIFDMRLYMGLGIEGIIGSFSEPAELFVPLIKLVLTAFTIAYGFKGGEVTPLFFIGATLGSVLSLIIPLPLDLLAGMGMVAVFAAASNAPIACIFMGLELFGMESSMYIAIACYVAYLFSGKLGIYSAQRNS